MSDADALSELFSLPGLEDIKRWEAEYRRMGDAIMDLETKRAKLARIIAAARGEGAPAASSIPKRKRDGTYKAGTWINVLSSVVTDNPEGISYESLKEKVPGELGEKLRENPCLKAFYTSLRRLERDEVIVRHKGHAFTPSGFKRYLDKVERGEASLLGGSEYGQSPMGDAIMALVARNGPSKASDLRQQLAATEEFRESMKNHSAIYNVIRRLVNRGLLSHDEQASTYLMANENGALIGKAASAPETGEVRASPIDNQATLRLIG